MDEHIEQIYLQEIETQASFALNAVNNLNMAMQAVNSTVEQSAEQRQYAHREVFRSIHSFLTHASNVSKLLWAPAPQRIRGESATDYRVRQANLEQRGNDLRQLLDISEDNPIKNRSLRNHLEHFDERLANWEETSSRRNFMQDTIGPQNAISGINMGDMMRHFDPNAKLFHFRGETYDIQDLVTAIDNLVVKAKSLSEERLQRRLYGESV